MQSDRVLMEAIYAEVKRLRGAEEPVRGLTQKEAAKRLGVSPRTLRDLIRKGVVRFSPLGGLKRISTKEIERVLTPVQKVKRESPRGYRRDRSTKEESAAIRAAMKRL